VIIRDRRTKVKTQFIHQLTCQSPSIVGVGNAGTACSQQSTVPVDALESAAYDIVAENAQHSDIDEDQDGNAIGVSGVLWGSFQSKQLRTICSRCFASQRSQKREKEHHGGTHCKVAQQQEEL